MTLLDTALSAGMKADYVLFDSWFSNPAQVTDIHSKGMNVIAMIKESSRIKYSYCGEQLNIKEIYSRNKKRRGRSKYLLSVDVMVGKENPIPAKIVCIKGTKRIARGGLLFYLQIRLFPKRRAFVFMENAGRLSFLQDHPQIYEPDWRMPQPIL